MSGKTRELYHYLGRRNFWRWHLHWLTSGLLPRHFDVDSETRDAVSAAQALGALSE